MGKILSADDDAMIQDIITRALYGHEVITVPNGAEAVAAAKKHNPDVIILDVAMPVMDGLAACKALKWDPELKSIPVLMLTGHGKMETVEESFEVQADDILMKPFSPKVLAAHVSELLKKRA